jgi:type I restriction enzyme S subunit
MTDWPIKSLGEVCDFVRGVTYDKADARSAMKNGFIPLLRATNITEKGLLREDFVFVPSDGVRADQKLISGDALITIASGSASVVGRSVLVEDPGEMTFGAFCGVLRPGPGILPKYLSHFMSSRSVRTAWSEAAQGTNINNLKRDVILQTECLLPPLEEQKRIVALLDAATVRVTELTACYEQARTHANNIYLSALTESFEKCALDVRAKQLTIAEICKIGDGNHSAKYPKSSEFVVKGVPFIRANNISNGKVSAVDMRFISEKKHNELRKGHLRTGDVLITNRGEIGSLAIVGSEFDGSNLNSQIAWLRVSDLIINRYLYHFLGSPNAKAQFFQGTTGAALQQLTIFQLRKIRVPIVPLKTQQSLIDRLDDLKSKSSEVVAAYDAKLAAAKDLRQSMLEAAFVGSL